MGRLAKALAKGIESGELELLYQPQLALGDGDAYGVEALVRWRRRGELLRPAEFLPLAERSGAIDALTERVLELAIAQAGSWHRQGRGLRVAINLSPHNLQDFSVPTRLEALLSTHGVAASQLTIEITETAVLREPEKARAVLDAIAELGVRVSIDDFGTGYSSLLWLWLFPVSEVKVDRSFVNALDVDGDAYVAGVVRLAHDLGLSVVAEGVESAATLEALQDLDCDCAQGFHFAPPLEPDELIAWVDEHADRRWRSSSREIAVDPREPVLDRARELIAEAAGELGYRDDAIWELQTAATEALMNAIEHGPPSEDGLVRLRVVRRRDELRLEVWGGATQPGPPSPEAVQRGRGMAIMAALMDEVELRRRPDRATIVLGKRRAA